MAISEAMPPIRPIICLLVNFSWKSRSEAREERTIALPLTRGKKSWLGKSPESLRLMKFIPKIQMPQRKAKKTRRFVNFSSPNGFLARILEKIREQRKAMRRKPPVSFLYTELWWIFCNTPMVP